MGLGEIRLYAGKWAPENWAFCDGAMLQIQEYRGLFDEINTRYGGDGRTTFALPDLRGRAAMHRADGAALGTKGNIPVDAARSNYHPARMALNFILATKHSYMLETSEPVIGEIRPFGFNFVPVGWASCDGSLRPIERHIALFSLLESAYGGDGTRTFAVPDLRGAYPFQPNDPGDRGKRAGALPGDDAAPQTPLLVVNHCIAIEGLYPPRP